MDPEKGGKFAGPRKSIWWQIAKIAFLFISIGVLIAFITIFVIVPIIFMLCIEVQRLTMFTNVFLETRQDVFESRLQYGMRNLYVTISNIDNDELISLGVYHVLPQKLIWEAQNYKSFGFDFDGALKNSNFSVLMYFHGSGEDRIDSIKKYYVLNSMFHVIAFDYRDYGDSSRATLSEKAIAEDSMQIYKWLRNKTDADIYFWGHSLGTALSTDTIVRLAEEKITPTGLILEAPFTNMREEIPNHPYGKIFSWMPWFKVTILDPLEKNDFVFENIRNVIDVGCPIMILHAMDDSIIPAKLGYKLYKFIKQSKKEAMVQLHQFPADKHYDHFFLYEDENLPKYIENFVKICNSNRTEELAQDFDMKK